MFSKSLAGVSTSISDGNAVGRTFSTPSGFNGSGGPVVSDAAETSEAGGAYSDDDDDG